MHSFMIKVSAAVLAVVLFVSEVAASLNASTHSHCRSLPSKHRRHHEKKSHCKSHQPSGTSKPTSTSSSSSSTSTSASSSSISSSGSLGSSGSSRNATVGSTSNFGLTSSLLSSGGVFLAFLPDDGDAGGSRETMSSINSAIGAKSAGYGWYAQAQSGTTFDGSQLLEVMDDVKNCKCVFHPAVMPTGGWQGLTSSDNSQAKAIATVMKKFTDEGIPVWLRFAHEMNYYQTDGTYQGTAADFKEGWATVAAAIKEIAPDVKMWWTPNVASADSYAEYAPEDMSTVDLVGIDYYPKSLSDGDFVRTMGDFANTYAKNGIKFAIGETGLGYAGGISDRLSWLSQIIKAKSEIPQMVSVSWFNYMKGYDFRIVDESSINSQFTSLMSTKTA